MPKKINSEKSLKGRTILLVNIGSLKKSFILKKINKLDIKVVVLNKEKVEWAKPLVDHWILADTFNHKESLQAVQKFMITHPTVKIEGAVTFWEDDVLLTSKIIDKFNFIGIPHSIAQKARNKFMFRSFCSQNNLPVPQFKLIRTDADLEEVIKTFKFPLVVKPTYGSSSAFVIKTENKDELRDAYLYARKGLSTQVESALSDGMDILVEEYIDGDEVDIDILIQNGRIKFVSISDNDKTAEPFFIETGFSTPSSLPEDDQEALKRMADETLEKLNIQNGCLHYEAKMTKTGPYPIEVNLRLGGDEVYSFMKTAWKVDMIEHACKIALGIYFPKIEKPDEPYRYLAGSDFMVEDSGIISYLEIDPEIKKKKYLGEVQVFKKIGDPIFAPPEGFEYLGWVTVTGDNPIDAEDNLNEALEFIDYEISRFHGDSLIGKTQRKNQLAFASIKKDLLFKAAKIEQLKHLKPEEQRKLHIGILTRPEKKADELKPTENANLISSLLQKKGYRVSTFMLTTFPETFLQIQKANVNLILNLVETEKENALKSQAKLLLDLSGIPFSGPNSFAATLISDEFKSKKLLQFHDIPTPDWEFVYSNNDLFDLDELSFPLTVSLKDQTNRKDYPKAIIKDKKDLFKKVIEITDNFKNAACLEEHIEGERYLIAVLGNSYDDLEALPIVEIKKGNHEKRLVLAKKMDNKISSLVTEIAFDTYSILGCSDFALIEVTVDEESNPYVTNIYASPSLKEDGEIFQIAKLARIDFVEILEKIISTTFKYYKAQPSLFQLD
jgi:carnosine synthase